ncbi:hypothetical protein VNI00_018283 [Paramarasmius palmivorus]|uniref:Uncharacterized protein n=1 Tax=Paramarasmius palmivorus TaxID=297713 RepID=A0AAW0AZ19_9AGAR
MSPLEFAIPSQTTFSHPIPTFLSTPPESPVETRGTRPSVLVPSVESLSSDEDDANDLFSDEALSQPKGRLNEHQKVGKSSRYLIGELGFDSVAHFMVSFTQQIRREDARTRRKTHLVQVQRFLQGLLRHKPVRLAENVRMHRYSPPSYRSNEIYQDFDPEELPTDIRSANPQLFNWAVRIVGNEVHREINKLGEVPDNSVPGVENVPPRLAASANVRMKENGVKLVTRENILSLDLKGRIGLFQIRAPVSWYITEGMCAPRKDGRAVIRKRRPTAMVRLSELLG